MITQLETIIAQKQQEVAALQTLITNRPKHVIAEIYHGRKKIIAKKNFKSVLKKSSLAIIAEIKRKSPSKGALAPIKDVNVLARKYSDAGANAISVLTDEKFFAGNMQDLTNVVDTLKQSPQPILRKDFIIHELQIAEAKAAGADAILAIVAVLGAKTQSILKYAANLGLDVLVEVHNQAELDVALQAGATIIGINNRNLSSFQVDTQNAFNLIANIPKNIIRVAESGILAPELAKEYYHAGFDAVLIGEALVTSSDPIAFIRACRNE